MSNHESRTFASVIRAMLDRLHVAREAARGNGLEASGTRETSGNRLEAMGLHESNPSPIAPWLLYPSYAADAMQWL